MTDAPSDKPFSARFPEFTTLIELWESGDLESSAALIKNARRDLPDDPAVELLCASQLLRQDAGGGSAELIGRVRDYLVTARRLADGNASVLVVTGLFFADAELWPEAVWVCKEVADASERGALRDEDVASFLCLAGRVADWQSEDTEAERLLRGAIELGGNHPEPGQIAALASFLRNRGRDSEAVSLVKRASADWPENKTLRRLAVEVEGRRIFTVRPPLDLSMLVGL